jgi:hypothetical protein
MSTLTTRLNKTNVRRDASAGASWRCHPDAVATYDLRAEREERIAPARSMEIRTCSEAWWDSSRCDE